MKSNRNLLQRFLSGIETGDAMAAAVVNEAKYIQHNPQTGAGSAGIAALFEKLSKTSPRVHFHRVFEDGDFAFAHIEYDFSSLRAAFEVFRFEDGLAVEHWDNIQPKEGPNGSGRGMFEGATDITDLDKTEANRAYVRDYVEAVLIPRDFDRIRDYVAADLIQHNPTLSDGVPALVAALTMPTEDGLAIKYDRLHRVLAEGNFVLAVNEGTRDGARTSFYDLYRLADGRIVEHWDTIEAIPPRSAWKNDNGKF